MIVALLLFLNSFLSTRGEAVPHLECGGQNITSCFTEPELMMGVEWHIPVGCGFSGFYTEFLGLVSVLEPALPQLRISSGPCSSEFFESQLFSEEAGPMKRANVPVSQQMRADQERLKARDDDESQGATLPETLNDHTPFGFSCSNAANYDVEKDFSSSSSADLDNVDFFRVLADRDLPGNDLPRARDGYPVSNATVCDCLCVQTLACVGWTFRKFDRQCWLKARTASPTASEAGSSPIVPGLVSRRIGADEGEKAVSTTRLSSSPSSSSLLSSSAFGSSAPPLGSTSLIPQLLPRQPLPRIDVWHGRCEADVVSHRAAAKALRKTHGGREIHDDEEWGGGGGGGGSSSDSRGQVGGVDKVYVRR